MQFQHPGLCDPTQEIAKEAVFWYIKSMEEQLPETQQQFQNTPDHNKHLHPKVWIGALLAILIVAGYGAYAFVTEIWPFEAEQDQLDNRVTPSKNVSPEKLDVDTLPIGYSNSRDFVLTMARLRSLQTALALYFEDHNAYPMSLAELLAPDYIHNQTDLLLNAYTSEQFVYRPSADNFQICGSSDQDTFLCIYKKVEYNSGINGYAYLHGIPYVVAADGYNVQIRFKNEYKSIGMTLQLDGSFTIELPPGMYIVSDSTGELKTQTVQVFPDQYTTISLTEN